MKAIALVIVGAIVVYIAVSFFPLFSVPFDLENKLKELSKQWLRLPRMDQTPERTRALIKTLKKEIKERLEDHEYDEKKVGIIIPGQNSVKVKFPYTMHINLFGADLSFEKNVDFTESKTSF
jgi:hypothetical protein